MFQNVNAKSNLCNINNTVSKQYCCHMGYKNNLIQDDMK